MKNIQKNQFLNKEERELLSDYQNLLIFQKISKKRERGLIIMMKEITISENDIFYKDMIDNMKIFLKKSENILNSREYIDFERKMNEFLNHSDKYQYTHDNFIKIYIDSEKSIYINMILDKYKDDSYRNLNIIDISLINEKRIKKELDLIRIRFEKSEFFEIFIKIINLSIYDLYNHKYNDFLDNLYQNNIIIE